MDLDALLSALQTTQQKKSSVRLSERNVVELVMKLKQLGFFGEELLHTINGKEYITTDRLKTDIQAALRQAGGRLELTELPALVGVDLVHCEKQAAAIVAESNGSVLEAQGELMTTQYFDSLAAEINELLQESGVLSIADLAISHSLNTELLRGVISSRMATTIKGQLEAGLLYTPAYVRNIKAQVRGALRGTTAPVAMAALVKELGLDGLGSSNSMMAQLVEELLQEKAVAGSTKGGGGNWVPTIHTAAQQGAVTGFWQQNGWVSYELVRKAGISNEKNFVKQTFPDGVALDSVYVGSSIVAQAEAAAEETVRNGTWLDVSTVLPPSLTAADVSQLLERCCSELVKDPEHKQGQVLAATCIVSAPVIAAVKEGLEALAKQEADKAITERRKSAAAAATASSTGSGNGSSTGTPAAGAKKGSAAAAAPSKDDDSDDDWSMGGKKGGKKGRATGAGSSKGKGGKAAGSSMPGKQSSRGGGAAADSSAALSVGVLQRLLELFPDMEDAGPSGGLPRAVVELLRPAAVASYQEALTAVFTSSAEARRKIKDSAVKALEEAFGLLQLYERGCEVFQGDEATVQVMQRHLLRSTGAEGLDQLMTWCHWEFNGEAAAEQQQQQQQQQAGATACFTPAERSKLVKALPPEVGGALTRATEAGNGTDVQEFVTQLEAAAAECGIRLRRLDKKTEKPLLTAQRARLMQLLEPEASPAAALSLALPLLVLKVSGKLANIPGRAIGGVLAALEADIAEDDFSMMQQFHQLVVDSLKLQAAVGKQLEDEGQQQAAQHLQQQLTVLLPRVKTLVGLAAGSSS